MRSLTCDEREKLDVFRKHMDAMIAKEEETLFGRFKSWFEGLRERQKLVLDSIEIFTTHDINELHEHKGIIK